MLEPATSGPVTTAAVTTAAAPDAAPASESPVYAFLRNPTMVDFPGRLAAVFFTSGCNFRCGFCHNARLMGRRQRRIEWCLLREACDRFRGDWVDGAVVSGGEPTLEPDIVPLLSYFRGLGWPVKLDTNGSNPDALERCLPLIDYVAMDVKTAFSAYAGLTGFADTARLSRSMELIRTRAADYEFRTTIIETVHTDAVMAEIARTVRGARRYALQPFVPREDLPDEAFRAAPRTSPDRMKQVADMMRGCAGEVVVRGG